jgi:hypothetical protein
MPTHIFELVEDGLAWLPMRHTLGPSILDNFLEAGHPNPIVFELEASRFLRALHASEEQWAMIREGGGEGVKDVVSEMQVPLRIAKNTIKLAKSRISPLIGPSEAAILKRNLMKLAIL